MAANPAVPQPELSFEIQRSPGEATVICTGRMVNQTNPLLQQTIRGLIPTSKVVSLDLTNVTYMDSSGLGTIVGLYASARKANCKLKLINLGPRIKELLSITRLAPLFEGHEDMLGMTPD